MYIVTLHQNPDYPTQIGKKRGHLRVLWRGH